jgi:hypothetical protein
MPKALAEDSDQLPDESPQAFAAWVIYRDMGPKRSIDEASRRYHNTATREPAGTQGGPKQSPKRKSGRIRQWARRFSWRERAAAYDREVDRQRLAALAEARIDMAKRQVQQARALQFKAIERLAQLKPDDLGPCDVLNFIMQATRLERQALGEPEEVKESRIVGKDGGALPQVILYIPDNGRDPGQLMCPPVVGLPEMAEHSIQADAR